VGRKDQRRRRQQSTAATPKPKPIAPAVIEPVDDDVPTWEERLEKRAVRDRWPMPPEMRVKILSRLMDIVDWRPTRDRFDPPSHRDINSAAKTILTADRLNVEQEKLEAAKAAAVDAETTDVPIDPAVAARVRELYQSTKYPDGSQRPCESNGPETPSSSGTG
jgi:hypothetical protein